MSATEVNTLSADTRHQSLLEQIADEQAHRQAEMASRYMPTLTPKQFTDRENLIAELRDMLVKDVDYGVIPGTEKPTLLLPGAQKVCAYFGYVPKYDNDPGCIEDWNGGRFGEPLFYYRITCVLTKDEKRVGEGIGSCNSWESKYRFRWVKADDVPSTLSLEDLPTRAGTTSEFAFAVDKAETSGKYGKSPEYWQRWQAAIDSGEARRIKRKTSTGKEMDAWEMGDALYQVPNEKFPDTINTVLKMAKKRAYIDATLSATGLSQYFTQDVEDLNTEGIETGGHPVGTQAAADHVRDQSLAKTKPSTRPADPSEELDPPELKAILNRLYSSNNQQETDAIFAEVCDALAAAKGDDFLQTCWASSVKRHGDPDKKPGAAGKVMRDIFNALILRETTAK